MTDSPAFLNVEKSVSGRRWELRNANDREALALSQRFSIPDAVARVLAGRGIGLEDAQDYLEPSIKNQLPDPSHLLDMDKAVEHIVRAVENGDKIAVFGDYDVDGATSSALLYRFFKMIGVDATVYIPDRIVEGYGPNLQALKKLHAQGVKVVVTVDCGTTAFDVLEGAKAVGLDMIVIDHHVAEPRLPDVLALVNPNRLDDESVHGNLAAVGVAFLFAVALNRAFKDVGFFASRRPPDLLSLLDLVALGTVCDVVPLKGVNRALVAQGLKVMAKRANVGINALSDVAGVDEMPTAYHLGFQIGPRLNAGGRVGEAALGSRILSTDNPNEAKEIALHLDKLNQERKGIESICLDEAIEQVENTNMRDGLVYAASEGWHPGVIGIVASRLKERYNRPACVVALENGIGKGSGRSIDGVDLGAAIIGANQAGFLENGGGHKMAAGFTVSESNNDAFHDYLAERIGEQIGAEGIVPRLSLDGAVSVSGANLDLVQALDRLAPFGAGNATPRFVLTHVRVGDAAIVGTDHVRCRLGAEGGGSSLKGIAFRCADQPLGDLLLSAKGGMPIHVVGRLQLDTWQGREGVQIIIDDAAPAL